MIFSVARLIADTSQYVVLQPGDVITTGTPPGVGLGMKPPQFLKPGDVMRLGVERLGVQEQRVVRWEER
jgi:2-keto-4-pentenoate hydratase/2-oxohepta-3-ene-1,7-dioic acid hydratase in catechol pathway